jgi:hypothetical protein
MLWAAAGFGATGGVNQTNFPREFRNTAKNGSSAATSPFPLHFRT